jgi:hypothetical protein
VKAAHERSGIPLLADSTPPGGLYGNRMNITVNSVTTEALTRSGRRTLKNLSFLSFATSAGS